MRSNPSFISARHSQTGGITILVALVLLSIMTVAAMSMSQNTLRELAITGNESTGRKAAESADSALDWVLIWSNPNAASSILASTDPITGANTSTLVTTTLPGAPGIVQAQMTKLLAAIGDSNLRVIKLDPSPNAPAGSGPDDYGNQSGNSGSLRFFLRSVDFDKTSAPELFQTAAGGTGFTQKDSVVAQAFDVEVRYLGESLANRSSGFRAKKQGGLFLIRSVGRANIGTTGQSFIALREALVDYTP